jgi:hypothetical protein
MTDEAKRFWDGDLYKLLVARITDCNTPRGAFSVAVFAKKMGYSPEGLYKYLRSDTLSIPGAIALLKAAEGSITYGELTPFLMKQLTPGSISHDGARFMMVEGGASPTEVMALLFPN